MVRPAAKKATGSKAKTQLTGAPVQRFLAGVPQPMRDDCAVVSGLMEAATGTAAEMWGSNIVGFGRRTATYADGRQAEWMVAAFAPRKDNITLYLNTAFDGSDALLARLGPHKMGKSCLHIKRLSDVSMPVLTQLVTAAVLQTKAAKPR